MMLKQNNLSKMTLSILKNRDWSLRFCFYKRNSYLSGKSLQFKLCYLGRKKIINIVNSNYVNDDIWITKKEFLSMIKNGVV